METAKTLLPSSLCAALLISLSACTTPSQSVAPGPDPDPGIDGCDPYVPPQMRGDVLSLQMIGTQGSEAAALLVYPELYPANDGDPVRVGLADATKRSAQMVRKEVYRVGILPPASGNAATAVVTRFPTTMTPVVIDAIRATRTLMGPDYVDLEDGPNYNGRQVDHIKVYVGSFVYTLALWRP